MGGSSALSHSAQSCPGPGYIPYRSRQSALCVQDGARTGGGPAAKLVRPGVTKATALTADTNTQHAVQTINEAAKGKINKSDGVSHLQTEGIALFRQLKRKKKRRTVASTKRSFILLSNNEAA